MAKVKKIQTKNNSKLNNDLANIYKLPAEELNNITINEIINELEIEGIDNVRQSDLKRMNKVGEGMKLLGEKFKWKSGDFKYKIYYEEINKIGYKTFEIYTDLPEGTNLKDYQIRFDQDAIFQMRTGGTENILHNYLINKDIEKFGTTFSMFKRPNVIEDFIGLKDDKLVIRFWSSNGVIFEEPSLWVSKPTKIYYKLKHIGDDEWT